MRDLDYRIERARSMWGWRADLDLLVARRFTILQRLLWFRFKIWIG